MIVLPHDSDPQGNGSARHSPNDVNDNTNNDKTGCIEANGMSGITVGSNVHNDNNDIVGSSRSGTDNGCISNNENSDDSTSEINICGITTINGINVSRMISSNLNSDTDCVTCVDGNNNESNDAHGTRANTHSRSVADDRIIASTRTNSYTDRRTIMQDPRLKNRFDFIQYLYSSEKKCEFIENKIVENYKPTFIPVDPYLSSEINCELINADLRNYPWKKTPFGDVYYSPRYSDDRYTYRHVILSRSVRKEAERLAATMPGGLLTEEVFIHYLGIALSPGWSHFMCFNNKLKELILRRPKEEEDSTTYDAESKACDRILSNNKRVDGAPGPGDEVDYDSDDDDEHRLLLKQLRESEVRTSNLNFENPKSRLYSNNRDAVASSYASNHVETSCNSHHATSVAEDRTSKDVLKVQTENENKRRRTDCHTHNFDSGDGLDMKIDGNIIEDDHVSQNDPEDKNGLHDCAEISNDHQIDSSLRIYGTFTNENDPSINPRNKGLSNEISNDDFPSEMNATAFNRNNSGKNNIGDMSSTLTESTNNIAPARQTTSYTSGKTTNNGDPIVNQTIRSNNHKDNTIGTTKDCNKNMNRIRQISSRTLFPFSTSASSMSSSSLSSTGSFQPSSSASSSSSLIPSSSVPSSSSSSVSFIAPQPPPPSSAVSVQSAVPFCLSSSSPLSEKNQIDSNMPTNSVARNESTSNASSVVFSDVPLNGDVDDSAGADFSGHIQHQQLPRQLATRRRSSGSGKIGHHSNENSGDNSKDSGGSRRSSRIISAETQRRTKQQINKELSVNDENTIHSSKIMNADARGSSGRSCWKESEAVGECEKIQLEAKDKGKEACMRQSRHRRVSERNVEGIDRSGGDVHAPQSASARTSNKKGKNENDACKRQTKRTKISESMKHNVESVAARTTESSAASIDHEPSLGATTQSQTESEKLMQIKNREEFARRNKGTESGSGDECERPKHLRRGAAGVTSISKNILLRAGAGVRPTSAGVAQATTKEAAAVTTTGLLPPQTAAATSITGKAPIGKSLVGTRTSISNRATITQTAVRRVTASKKTAAALRATAAVAASTADVAALNAYRKVGDRVTNGNKKLPAKNRRKM